MHPLEYCADLLCGTTLLLSGYHYQDWTLKTAGGALIVLTVTGFSRFLNAPRIEKPVRHEAGD